MNVHFFRKHLFILVGVRQHVHVHMHKLAHTIHMFTHRHNFTPHTCSHITQTYTHSGKSLVTRRVQALKGRTIE